MVLRAAIAFLGVISLLSSTALAAKRVALVVGNAAYLHTAKLANPKNDATDVVAVLKKHGFVIIEGFDVDKAAFDRKVLEFAAALRGADAGVFFYAGHGLQVAGHNYLVPIDAKAEAAETLDFEMLRVDVVHRIMERQTNTNILFLDACRDNPLARNLARSMGTRSSEVGRGLAAVESGVGTLISFSTQPGNVALDGTGRNSPFAAALVKHMATANDDLSAILIDVRNDVRKATQNKQVPWEHSALTGRFYFGQVPQARPPAAAPAPAAQIGEAERTWALIQGTKSIAVLEDFIARYKESIFAKLAQERIDDLNKQEVAVAAPKAPPSPAPKRADPTVGAAEAKRKKDTAAAQRVPQPGETFRDCYDDDLVRNRACPEMMVVPAGNFTMGSNEYDSERPLRTVTIAKPFAVGKFEVTFDEWEACMASGGCLSNHRPSDAGWGRGRRPVIDVSWNDAQEYVTWLSRKTGKTYRLLTEAEWEYAARAGTTTKYPWGNDIGKGNANCNGCGSQWDNKHSAPVGSFEANAFGLHDMHGNVWEWVEDTQHANYKGAPTDGAAWIDAAFSQSSRILRGGSWDGNSTVVRSANRNTASPHLRSHSFGFRVATTISPSSR